MTAQAWPQIDLDAATQDTYGRDQVRAAWPAGGLTLTYAAWPSQVAIYEAMPDGEVPEGAEVAATRALHQALGPWRDNVIHAAVSEASTLRWYQTSCWAHGAVVSGVLAGHPLYYDTLHTVPEAWLDAVRPGDGTQVVVMASRTADHRVLPCHLRPREIGRRLRAPNWVERVVTLRSLALWEQQDAELVMRAHLDALLDAQYAVRHFAAVQLSGITGDRVVRPDVGALLGMLSDPLASLPDFGPRQGPDGGAWCPTAGRRHARVAVLWVLGHLADAALQRAGSQAAAQLQAVAVPALAQGVDPVDEVRASTMARAEVRASGPTEAGLGVDAPVSLSLCLRYLQHRRVVARALGTKDEDRYVWLDQSLASLLAFAAAEGVGWPASPPAPTSLGVQELPAWLRVPTA